MQCRYTHTDTSTHEETHTHTHTHTHEHTRTGYYMQPSATPTIQKTANGQCRPCPRGAAWCVCVCECVCVCVCVLKRVRLLCSAMLRESMLTPCRPRYFTYAHTHTHAHTYTHMRHTHSHACTHTHIHAYPAWLVALRQHLTQ